MGIHLPDLGTANLLQVSLDQLIQIGVIVGILLVVWIVLRTLLRLTMRIFQLGCMGILVFGIVIFLLRYISGA
jgi:hypothetical protein